MSCEASTPATVTLIDLKDIIDRNFAPPFLPRGIVKTCWDHQGLQLTIGPREVTIKLDGTLGDTGTSFMARDQIGFLADAVQDPQTPEDQTANVTALFTELDKLHDQGVRAVVCLHPEVFSALPDEIQAQGWYKSFPLIQDIRAPIWAISTQPQLVDEATEPQEFLDAMDRATEWGQTHQPPGTEGFRLIRDRAPNGDYLFIVELRHTLTGVLLINEVSILKQVIDERRFDVISRVVSMAMSRFKKVMGFFARYQMQNGIPVVESLPPEDFLAQIKSGQIKLPDVETAKTFADYEKEFPTEGPNWHAPSLEAFIEGYQWPSARAFADDVLKFIADRKALAGTTPEHPINWDFPTLEAFVAGNYWWNAEDAIGDIRKFIMEHPQKSSWTEAEIRAAYFSKASDHEGLTSEGDLIDTLKEATANGTMHVLLAELAAMEAKIQARMAQSRPSEEA